MKKKDEHLTDYVLHHKSLVKRLMFAAYLGKLTFLAHVSAVVDDFNVRAGITDTGAAIDGASFVAPTNLPGPRTVALHGARPR